MEETQKRIKVVTLQWDSISNDGYRVKHRMFRDGIRPDAFWHIETRLTDNPVPLADVHYEVYPRKFFGKVWVAQKIECHLATTWKAMGDAVRQIEIEL